ncbi:MAG: phosphate signaling complex protein PhoU [SAR324 cluster bacterium]|nr:phosphate signaling complex protein PhoU [SAR324 cluster bacterium]
MHRHFEKGHKKLNSMFEDLCNTVENNFTQLTLAMEKMDVSYFDKFPDLDLSIDEKEIAIEEECLKLLALYQPVAGDLRSIIAILKVNGEIERIGDLTSNIAYRAKSLHSFKMEASAFLIPEICTIVRKMLHNSLKSFMNRDRNMAIKVCHLDEQVDDLHGDMYKVLRVDFEKNPKKYDAYMSYISMSRFLERIGDHTTNIAEDLLYLMEGEIFRHRKIEVYRPTD